MSICVCISLVALLYAKSRFFMHETPQSTLTHTRRFFVIAISSRSGWLAVWLVVSIWWLLWFIVVQFELVNSDTIKKRSCCPFIIIIHYFFLAQIHLALRLHWMIFNVCLLFSFLLAFFRGKLWHQPQQMQFFWHLNGNVLTFIFGIKCWRAAFFSFVIRVSPVRHEKSGLNTLRWCCHVAPVVLFRLFSFKFKFHMLQMCHAQRTMNGTFLRSKWLCECWCAVFFLVLLLHA